LITCKEMCGLTSSNAVNVVFRCLTSMELIDYLTRHIIEYGGEKLLEPGWSGITGLMEGE